MIIDCHVHTNLKANSKEDLIKQLDTAGIEKMVLLSVSPLSFYKEGNSGGPVGASNVSPEIALANVIEWSLYSDRIIPFFWIDPLDQDAFDQVDNAVKAGIKGFKVICNRHYPGDTRPMQVWEHISKKNKPILFHSGILYGNGPWSQYNRPAFFEALFDIQNLRFAMAHVSWPWHDECLAVYGYWQNRRERGTSSAQMFIDTTPGSPKIYRNDIFYKIYNIGYNIEDNLIFGTDCNNNYSSDYAKQILAMDKEALDFAGANDLQREKYFSKNFLRFLNG